MACTLESLMFAVAAGLGPKSPTHKYGAKHLDDNSSPPRVVWERLPATFGKPTVITSNPRVLWIKSIELALHFWGTDEDACDQMVDSEIASLDKQIHGAYRLVRLEPGAANKDWLVRGHAQVLTLSIDFKVLDQIIPVVKLVSTEFDSPSTAAPNDGWLDAGEP